MHCDKKKLTNLIEFILILVFLILPPIFTKKTNIMFYMPATTPELLFFVLKVVFFAAYEEILYRIYFPFRIKSFYPKEEHTAKRFFFTSEVLPILFFGAAHRYSGVFNVLYAASAGGLFRIVYVLFKKQKKITVGRITIIFIHAVHNILWLIFYFKIT